MRLYARSRRLPSCCGIQDIGDFSVEKAYYEYDKDYLSKILKNQISGTGMYTASFIDTPECKEAYRKLKKRFDIIYQSPLKHNTNSGRKLFLCVFMDKAK